ARAAAPEHRAQPAHPQARGRAAGAFSGDAGRRGTLRGVDGRHVRHAARGQNPARGREQRDARGTDRRP
nr:hypothetical protein [Tanacetum cinerariifolium]